MVQYLDNALLGIKKGNIRGAKANLGVHFEMKNRVEWQEIRAVEYNELFTEEVVYELELAEGESYDLDMDGNEITEETIVETIEGSPTLADWLNETVVTVEAMDAVIIDVDGESITVTEAILEETELVRPYIPRDTADQVNTYIENSEGYISPALKVYKAKTQLVRDYIESKEVVNNANTYRCGPEDLKAMRDKILEQQDNMTVEFLWYGFDYTNAVEFSFFTSGVILREVLGYAEAEIDTFRDSTMAGE